MHSERLRLHAFQARLSERMQAAREDLSQRDNRLAVMMGEQYYLFDLAEAVEIMTATSVTAVPLTRDWYLGLVNVRGNLVGVVDYVRFCGGECIVRDKDARIVVPSSSLPVACGLLVSRVIGIVDLMQWQRVAVEVHVAAAAADGVSVRQRYRDPTGQVWQEIGFADLMADNRFLQVAL